MFKQLAVAAALAASACAQAQVPVVESSSQTSPSQGVSSKANQQAELFYQLQALQQEVLELRGSVEEQAYELKRLKKQRLDDYVDLDRRIVALGGSSANKPVASNTSSEAAPSEKQAYDKALALLRKRDTKASVEAFNQYLSVYPAGEYAANAHYWLGETHLLTGELESARQEFTLLLESYPGNRKIDDAKYKLGTVYFQLGDKTKARSLLDDVAAGSSSSARLARKYIQKNFAQ